MCFGFDFSPEWFLASPEMREEASSSSTIPTCIWIRFGRYQYCEHFLENDYERGGKEMKKNNKSPVPRNRVPENGRGPSGVLVLCSGFWEWTSSLSEPNSWLLTCHGLVSRVEFFRTAVIGSRDLNSKLQHQHQEHSGFCLLWLACWGGRVQPAELSLAREDWDTCAASNTLNQLLVAS